MKLKSLLLGVFWFVGFNTSAMDFKTIPDLTEKSILIDPIELSKFFQHGKSDHLDLMKDADFFVRVQKDDGFIHQGYRIRSGVFIYYPYYKEADASLRKTGLKIGETLAVLGKKTGCFPMFPILEGGGDNFSLNRLFEHHMEFLCFWRNKRDSYVEDRGQNTDPKQLSLQHKLAECLYQVVAKNINKSIQNCFQSLGRVKLHLEKCLGAGIIDPAELARSVFINHFQLNTWYKSFHVCFEWFPDLWSSFDWDGFFKAISFMDRYIMEKIPGHKLLGNSPFLRDEQVFMDLVSKDPKQRDLAAKAVLVNSFFFLFRFNINGINDFDLIRNYVNAVRWLHHLRPSPEELDCHIFSSDQVSLDDFAPTKSYWVLKKGKRFADFYVAISDEIKENPKAFAVSGVVVDERGNVVIDVIVNIKNLERLNSVISDSKASIYKDEELEGFSEANGIRFVIRNNANSLLFPVTAFPKKFNTSVATYVSNASLENYKQQIINKMNEYGYGLAQLRT